MILAKILIISHSLSFADKDFPYPSFENGIISFIKSFLSRVTRVMSQKDGDFFTSLFKKGLSENLLRKGFIENSVTAWSSGATVVLERKPFEKRFYRKQCNGVVKRRNGCLKRIRFAGLLL